MGWAIAPSLFFLSSPPQSLSAVIRLLRPNERKGKRKKHHHQGWGGKREREKGGIPHGSSIARLHPPKKMGVIRVPVFWAESPFVHPLLLGHLLLPPKEVKAEQRAKNKKQLCKHWGWEMLASFLLRFSCFMCVLGTLQFTNRTTH